jgi:general secretion pathway protein G
MRAGPRTGSTGFTAIEVLIALAILGVLASLAYSRYTDYTERVRVSTASTDINAIAFLVVQYNLDNRRFPDSLADVRQDSKLDPWGRPYAYFNLTTSKGNGKARKDKQLNPLNSDFDLYSVGKDGNSSASLQAKNSRDDVVRARDGRFVGLASEFDP